MCQATENAIYGSLDDTMIQISYECKAANNFYGRQLICQAGGVVDLYYDFFVLGIN